MADCRAWAKHDRGDGRCRNVNNASIISDGNGVALAVNDRMLEIQECDPVRNTR